MTAVATLADPETRERWASIQRDCVWIGAALWVMCLLVAELLPDGLWVGYVLRAVGGFALAMALWGYVLLWRARMSLFDRKHSAD